jgi:hypothetical protein
LKTGCPDVFGRIEYRRIAAAQEMNSRDLFTSDDALRFLMHCEFAGSRRRVI